MADDARIARLGLVRPDGSRAEHHSTHRPPRRRCVAATIHASGLDVDVKPGQPYRLYGPSTVRTLEGPDELWSAWMSPDGPPLRIRFASERSVVDVDLRSATVRFELEPREEGDGS